jgi:hypothetical protein
VRDHRLKHQSKESEIEYVALSDKWDIVARLMTLLILILTLISNQKESEEEEC